MYKKVLIMSQNLDRIIKGYRPRSESSIYWSLYYVLQFIGLMKVILRTNINKILKIVKAVR